MTFTFLWPIKHSDSLYPRYQALCWVYVAQALFSVEWECGQTTIFNLPIFKNTCWTLWSKVKVKAGPILYTNLHYPSHTQTITQSQKHNLTGRDNTTRFMVVACLCSLLCATSTELTYRVDFYHIFVISMRDWFRRCLLNVATGNVTRAGAKFCLAVQYYFHYYYF